MVYVYRRESSSGARLLAEALNGRRWRGRQTPVLRTGDVVVFWGEAPLVLPPGVRRINAARLQSKRADITSLVAAGVPTVEALDTAPAAQVDPALELYQLLVNDMGDFGATMPPRSTPLMTAISELITHGTRLHAALRTPAPTAPPPGEWLPRLNGHVGGDDLLDEPEEPDFWVKKLNLTAEVRVHSFDGRSIRAGKKAPREGFPNPHPWIRSWDAGWRIQYDGVSAKQAHRDIAHAAVRALGLTFGAVDIGIEATTGRLVVLEVNRAPGLEGGTVAAYAAAIQRFVAAPQTPTTITAVNL